VAGPLVAEPAARASVLPPVLSGGVDAGPAACPSALLAPHIHDCSTNHPTPSETSPVAATSHPTPSETALVASTTRPTPSPSEPGLAASATLSPLPLGLGLLAIPLIALPLSLGLLVVPVLLRLAIPFSLLAVPLSLLLLLLPLLALLLSLGLLVRPIRGVIRPAPAHHRQHIQAQQAPQTAG